MYGLVAGTVALLSSVLIGSFVLAQPVASASPDQTEHTGIVREEAVAFVLAEDPGFANLPDYERQRIEMQAQFSFNPVLGSGYYRVVPTAATQWTVEGAEDLVVFRHPRNWIVEIVLVRDCVELLGGEVGPLADPCSWRHAWYHRVQPDGTVTLLFEEGDPAPTLPAAE